MAAPRKAEPGSAVGSAARSTLPAGTGCCPREVPAPSAAALAYELEYARRLRALCKAEGHVGRIPVSTSTKNMVHIGEVVIRGRRYSSPSAAANAYGVTVSHIRRLWREGRLDDLPPVAGPVRIGGLAFRSRKAAAEALGVTTHRLSRCLAMGTAERDLHPQLAGYRARQRAGAQARQPRGRT